MAFLVRPGPVELFEVGGMDVVGIGAQQVSSVPNHYTAVVFEALLECKGLYDLVSFNKECLLMRI